MIPTYHDEFITQFSGTLTGNLNITNYKNISKIIIFQEKNLEIIILDSYVDFIEIRDWGYRNQKDSYRLLYKINHNTLLYIVVSLNYDILAISLDIEINNRRIEYKSDIQNKYHDKWKIIFNNRIHSML